MDEYTKKIIDDEYNKIIQRMKGNASIFGYPIDLDNHKMVIVSAYLMAQSDEMQKSAKTNDLYRELLLQRR